MSEQKLVSEDKIIYIDHDLCTGCEICEFVCSMTHEGSFNPYLSRIKAIRIEPVINWAIGCQFCTDAPCVNSCPRKALSKDEKTGIIILDEDKCTGCGFCVRACDFGAIQLSVKNGKPIVCDLCKDQEDGPQCIIYCPKEAIKLTTLQSVAETSRRQTVKNLLEGKITLEKE